MEVNDSKVAEFLSRVKLRREKNQLDRERDVTYPHYHAACLDCDWRWRSQFAPTRREPARVQAQAHRDDRGHRTMTLMDILDHPDMTYLPRDLDETPTRPLRDLGRDLERGCDVPMGELELCSEPIYCINCAACEVHCRCGDPVWLDDLMGETK